MIKLSHQVLRVLPMVMLGCGLLPATVQAQFTQQGPKLVGIDAVGGAQQGTSVSLSGDGNTDIVGGPLDNNEAGSEAGAAWVYTRSRGVWSQQGPKLVGTGLPVNPSVGISVSISGDGNTAIVGTGAQAALVYTRSGDLWSQQAKLVGTGGAGFGVSQGFSVSISGDGNTAIVGAPFDNIGNCGSSDCASGAAWVFTRSGGVWTQQGDKLVGTGAAGYANQGRSVSLSGDGDTAIVGGNRDNDFVGAAWVFTRSGGVWTQQGDKLVGTGAGSAFPHQGSSVSISGDGNTAIVGGPGDNSGIGAAWVFTRSGEVWSPQGSKLVGTGFVGGLVGGVNHPVEQGSSVSLSGDGNTAIVGGASDNDGAGAAWVFTRSGEVWSQLQAKLVGAGAVGAFVSQGSSVSLSGNSNYAIVGAYCDAFCTGAAWVYTRFAGTPGNANCVGVSVQSLTRNFGGLNAAAAALGFSNVPALQMAIMEFCSG